MVPVPESPHANSMGADRPTISRLMIVFFNLVSVFVFLIGPVERWLKVACTAAFVAAHYHTQGSHGCQAVPFLARAPTPLSPGRLSTMWKRFHAMLQILGLIKNFVNEFLICASMCGRKRALRKACWKMLTPALRGRGR